MKVRLDKFGPIRRYTLVESGDDCIFHTWGVIYLDLDRGALFGLTDTGNYTYYSLLSGRCFLQQMIYILTYYDDYLLCEIAKWKSRRQARAFVEMMRRHILPLLKEEYAHDED